MWCMLFVVRVPIGVGPWLPHETSSFVWSLPSWTFFVLVYQRSFGLERAHRFRFVKNKVLRWCAMEGMIRCRRQALSLSSLMMVLSLPGVGRVYP